MPRQWVTLVLIACLTLPAWAQTTPLVTKVPPPGQNEVERAERAFQQALIDVDIPALEKILVDDFVRVPPTGPNTTKAQWLKILGDREYQYTAFEAKIRTYRQYGDTMIVNSVMSISTRRAGQENHLELRLINVWVKVDGRWQLAAVQGTDMPPPADPQT